MANLHQLPFPAQPRQREVRIGTRYQHEAKHRRLVLDQEGQKIAHRWVSDGMKIIQNQGETL